MNDKADEKPYAKIVKNAVVYGLDDSIKASKYPMSVDIDTLSSDATPTVLKLANAPKGSGHDNFLNGIVVQFDLTLTNKAWVEAERYHFLDFVSSQSTMHKITSFDLDRSYIEYVDPRIVDIMKEKVEEYNSIPKENRDERKRKYLEILYSNPCGFKLTAKMTTNYRQLKTIYSQRKDHRLPEWRLFCEWIETLPHSEFMTGFLPNEKPISVKINPGSDSGINIKEVLAARVEYTPNSSVCEATAYILAKEIPGYLEDIRDGQCVMNEDSLEISYNRAGLKTTMHCCCFHLSEKPRFGSSAEITGFTIVAAGKYATTTRRE